MNNLPEPETSKQRNPVNRFPEFDRDRERFSKAAAYLLLMIGLVYWRGMQPDMGAVAVFALPAIVLAVMVWTRKIGWANLVAGLFALGWFSHGVMVAFVEPKHRIWALIVAALSVGVVLCVSWVGLKVRKAKRQGQL